MIKDIMDSEDRYGFEEDGTEVGENSDNDRTGYNESNGSKTSNGCGSSANRGMVDPLQAAQRDSSMLEVKVDTTEDVTDSSANLLKSQHKKGYKTKHKASFGTASSNKEEVAPLVKKAKLNVNEVEASNENVAVYAAGGVEIKEEGKQDTNPPAVTLQYHHRQRLYTKHVSTSGTSSSPIGDTSFSPTKRKDYQSSFIDSSSSNKVIKGKSSNSSDSGYGESNYSPEESNDSSCSTASKTSKVTDMVPQKEQVQWSLPLAPAFIICLIRKDLSKVWCELTTSIRTLSVSDDFESSSSSLKMSRLDSSSKQGEMYTETKELLLCFRPITEGLPDSDITSSSNSREAEAMMRGDRSQRSNSSGSNGSRSNGSIVPEN